MKKIDMAEPVNNMGEPIKIDTTPGAHSFLDALGVVSFKLACGCNVRSRSPREVEDDDLIIHFRQSGSEYPCTKHGDQVITKATTRLVGWRKTPKGWRAGR